MNDSSSAQLAARIQIVAGDITEQRVDAIVNAANSTLQGGGGVDGAIHRAAGPALLAACREVGPCPTGEARITPGFLLPARFVIHAVGPVWLGGDHNEDELLTSCYQHCFKLAAENAAQTIAFPAISAGAYRFPLERATQIALGETIVFLRGATLPATCVFVCFSDAALSCYKSSLDALLHADPTGE